MTPAWIAKLLEGAGTLGVSVDPRDAVRLGTFADLLLEWGRKMDLTSIDDVDQVREKHFLDSLAGESLFEGAGTLFDLGSGAGFPGLVLATVRPDLHVVSVESRSKKGAFQRQVVRDLKLTNVEVRTERAEDVLALRPPPRWITARALTDLPGLVVLCESAMQKGALLVAYKSSRFEEELLAVPEPRPDLLTRKEIRLPESGDPRVVVALGFSKCST